MTNKTRATVFVRLKDGVLDPQGVTIQKALAQMGYEEFESVRTGRFFELDINADTDHIDNRIDEISSKLLSNPVIENFWVERKQ